MSMDAEEIESDTEIQGVAISIHLGTMFTVFNVYLTQDSSSVQPMHLLHSHKQLPRPSRRLQRAPHALGFSKY